MTSTRVRVWAKYMYICSDYIEVRSMTLTKNKNKPRNIDVRNYKQKINKTFLF